MRLLLVTQDFPPALGGIQTWSSELARCFAKSCDAFAVVAPRASGGRDHDDRLPYPVYRTRTASDAMPFAAIGPILRARRELGIDRVLHAQWQTLSASVVAASLGGPSRRYVAAYGRELLLRPVPGPFRPAYDGLRRWTLRRAERIFPISEYSARLVADMGLSRRHLCTVHPGTDPGCFRPIDVAETRAARGLGQARVLMTVGRLERRKGIDTVIRALPSILSRVPDAVYVIVGQGRDRERLERLASDQGVGEAVQFWGAVDSAELCATYNLCDVFITASRSTPPDVEGFGIVFLEAGACGKPVIAGSEGGVPDAVDDDVTGLLVDPHSPDAVADAAVGLLLDEGRARRMGKAARERIEAVRTWAQTAERLLREMR